MKLDRTTLPDGSIHYKSTATFDASTVPNGLLRAHATKPGVWGLLVVLAGRLQFTLEGDPTSARGGGLSRVLGPGERLVIEPEVAHHVALLDTSTQFRVEFHRMAD